MKTLARMVPSSNQADRTFPSDQSPKRRLVVTERGAAEVDVALGDAAFEETLVVADAVGSPPAELALRVGTRIAVLERQHKTLSSATFVLASGRDTQRDATRELVARTLLTHLRAGGGGELVLFAPASGERDALLGLVEKLLRELDTRAVTLRLHFRDKKREQRAQADAAPAPRAWQAA